MPWRETVRNVASKQTANCKVAWILFVLLIIIFLCFCCSISSSYIAMYWKKDSLCSNVSTNEDTSA